MLIEQPPRLFRWFYNKAICLLPQKEKTVYLTFDDGPCPETTLHLLEVLDAYGVKATFFCVGENVQRYPDLFEEIVRRGHRVGNHTMSHNQGFKCSKAEYIDKVDEADALIHSDLFRPPHGRIKRGQYRALAERYQIVLWDVITRDYNPRLSPQRIVRIVKHYTRNGSVIVFHDSVKAKKNTFAALPEALAWLKGQGYKFELL